MHRVTRSGLTESADGSMARVANVYCRCGRHVGLDKGSLLMEVRIHPVADKGSSRKPAWPRPYHLSTPGSGLSLGFRITSGTHTPYLAGGIPPSDRVKRVFLQPGLPAVGSIGATQRAQSADELLFQALKRACAVCIRLKARHDSYTPHAPKTRLPRWVMSPKGGAPEHGGGQNTMVRPVPRPTTAHSTKVASMAALLPWIARARVHAHSA